MYYSEDNARSKPVILHGRRHNDRESLNYLDVTCNVMYGALNTQVLQLSVLKEGHIIWGSVGKYRWNMT